MKVLAWVFIGAMAFIATLVTIRTNDNDTAIIMGLIGTLAWLLFAYFSMEIVVYDANGSPTTTRYPAMAAFALAMAAPNLYIALTGPLEWLNDRDGLRREVM